MFAKEDKLLVTDYLIGKVKDLEPFIVQSLNVFDRKMISMRNHVDREIKTLNEKTVTFVD